MRNNGPWRASIVLALLLASVSASGAEAQSLFQNLFGNLFNSAPPPPAPSAPSITLSPQRQGANVPVQDFGYRHQSAPHSTSGGAYRTVCVRTCDGYYFPISGSASRSKFHDDAESCAERCGGGRLYYLPRQSQDMGAMLDLEGRRYDQLRNAFVYRKKLINGCACRPMPWSAAERARHNRYAYADEMLKQSQERTKQLSEDKLTRADAQALEQVIETAEPGTEMATEAEFQLGENPGGEAGTDEPVARDDSAYVAAVKAAITGTAAHEPAAGHVDHSPGWITKSSRPVAGKTVRTRKSKRKQGPANGWWLAGGGKYRWPGDR
ncbi:MAG: DUF2865 domain-containing protein [Alphaproteobacteria bacterium]|nr:DUF2865 domain-containing protein [Alphaproteobacteria bacterium]